MRSLLILATVFVLLGAYLESTATRAPDNARLTAIAKVIRTPILAEPARVTPSEEAVATAANTLRASHQQTVASPLNLKLPLVDAIKRRYVAGFVGKTQRSLLNLFKKEERQEISYSAELVYDAERGENITGGKLNIRIPLG